MRHDEARQLISLALDGELPSEEAADLERHLASCRDCAYYRGDLLRVRRELRFEPVEQVPDVSGRVVDVLRGRSGSQRARRWQLVAAAFLGGLVLGALLVGPNLTTPPSFLAAEIPELVLRAQADVSTMEASVKVTERGWHPEVPERRYRGQLTYQAPESLAISLEDLTDYPGEDWVSNHVSVVVDEDRWWAAAPAPCPRAALPGCTPREPRVQAIVQREPFSETALAPLDLVVPVRSFLPAAEVELLKLRDIEGREAVGVAVTVAQVRPLLDGLLGAGNWRELHPTDRVELWLDRRALTPLELVVLPGPGPDRELWAVRRGYVDDPDISILEVRFRDVAMNQQLDERAFPSPPDGVIPRSAGFEDLAWEEVDAPLPATLPPGFEQHRAGIVQPIGVAVRTWSDGSAWLKVRATRSWEDERLFGELGPAVRSVDLGEAGIVYVGAGGGRIALHGDEIDLEVTGTVGEGDLLGVVASLGVVGRPVPDSWREAGATTLEEALRALPSLRYADNLAGFDQPAIRVEDSTVTMVLTGPGQRHLTIAEAPGERLSPPLDADVLGVEVRGVPGRYTPSRGELEWVEDGLVVSLRADTLGLSELLAIAESLEPAG